VAWGDFGVRLRVPHSRWQPGCFTSRLLTLVCSFSLTWRVSGCSAGTGTSCGFLRSSFCRDVCNICLSLGVGLLEGGCSGRMEKSHIFSVKPREELNFSAFASGRRARLVLALAQCSALVKQFGKVG